MKKITFMMSLLLAMGSMTTSAQILSRAGWRITTSSECDDGGAGHANAIIDGKNNTYWHTYWNTATGAQGDKTETLPQFFQVDLGSEQEFNKIAYIPRDGLTNGTVSKYKIYVRNTPFEGVSNGKLSKDIVNALGSANYEGTFTYQSTDHSPVLKTAEIGNQKGRYLLFVVTEAINGFENGNAKPSVYASCAEFFLAKDVDFAFKDITYHFMVDGEERGRKTFNNIVDEKQQITTPTWPFLTNGEITATTDGHNIACTESLPFTAQKSFDASTAHWYVIDIHNNQANKLWYVANEGGLVTTPTIEKGSVTNLTDNYLWTFVGTLKDGFKIYNKVTGKAIAYTTNATTSDNGDVFQIKTSTGTNKANGFCFTKDGSNYLNEQGDKIGIYTSPDEGSTMHVQEPKSYVIAYAAPFINTDDSAAPQGAIGTNVYLTLVANKKAFTNAYNAAIASSATEADLNTLVAENKKVAAGNTETIEVGKYYRLYNTSDARKWLCVDNADNSKMNCNADAEKAVASVVTFVNAETGRYRMKIEGKTFGKYLQDYQAIALVGEDSGAKGSYIVNHVGTKFTFFDKASNNAHSYLHCNGNNLVGWEASDPSQWYVVPATDVEIAMNEVNGKRYASAYLPFAVNAVDGAQAYVGELNDTKNVLNMTAVNGVPANNGFVLVGNAEKATLTIGNAEPLTITNALTGSNVKVALETTTGSGENVTVNDHRADYLVFGTNAGNVGFYKPAAALTTIAANKAFVAASSLTTAPGAIAMNFGGNVTGINNAVVASENAPIFDLSGRRVVKAVKGGVYIQNGKKFVK